MGVYNHLINPGKGKEIPMKKIILIAAGAILALLMAAAAYCYMSGTDMKCLRL